MKISLLVVASLCAISSISAKNFTVKVKNPETNTEETEKINVDEEGQTETVDSKDQTFIKDFKTGYAAISLKNSNDCFVYKEDDDDDEGDSASADEEYLEALQASHKQEQTILEVSEKVSATEMTEEQRALVGDKIMQFCGTRRMLLGSKDADDDSDEDSNDTGNAPQTAGNRKKRDTKKVLSCGWKIVRKCAKVNMKITGCRKRVWGVCVWPKISFKVRWDCRNVRQLTC